MSPDPVHVLVYGSLDAGVAETLRAGQFVGPLEALGVELRSWESFADDLLSGDAPPPRRSPKRGDGEGLREAGLTALAWADVVVFRRWRSTHPVCTECETSFGRHAELAAHVATSGHRTIVPDVLLRPLVALLASHPELLRDRAVVYDTDDDVLAYPDWTGFGRAARRERDVTAQLVGLADLVTVATPVLAERLARLATMPPRVVRNAVDPAWYEGVAAEPGLVGEPRVVYHGAPIRLRDYAVAWAGVEDVAAEMHTLRRVWLGAADEPRVAACMDEVRPWVEGGRAFAAALVAARPDIGLAPLLDEPFNRARSELRWLEYALAGAPSIVSGFRGPGPFDVVRDGADGLVARSKGDWRTHLRSLAASKDLRAEIAGRARERVLAEYSVAVRAPEWADAFRWAAEHAGIGRSGAEVVERRSA